MSVYAGYFSPVCLVAWPNCGAVLPTAAAAAVATPWLSGSGTGEWALQLKLLHSAPCSCLLWHTPDGTHLKKVVGLRIDHC